MGSSVTCDTTVGWGSDYTSHAGICFPFAITVLCSSLFDPMVSTVCASDITTKQCGEAGCTARTTVLEVDAVVARNSSSSQDRSTGRAGDGLQLYRSCS